MPVANSASRPDDSSFMQPKITLHGHPTTVAEGTLQARSAKEPKIAHFPGSLNLPSCSYPATGNCQPVLQAAAQRSTLRFADSPDRDPSTVTGLNLGSKEKLIQIKPNDTAAPPGEGQALDSVTVAQSTDNVKNQLHLPAPLVLTGTPRNQNDTRSTQLSSAATHLAMKQVNGVPVPEMPPQPVSEEDGFDLGAVDMAALAEQATVQAAASIAASDAPTPPNLEEDVLDLSGLDMGALAAEGAVLAAAKLTDAAPDISTPKAESSPRPRLEEGEGAGGGEGVLDLGGEDMASLAAQAAAKLATSPPGVSTPKSSQEAASAQMETIRLGISKNRLQDGPTEGSVFVVRSDAAFEEIVVDNKKEHLNNEITYHNRKDASRKPLDPKSVDPSNPDIFGYNERRGKVYGHIDVIRDLHQNGASWLKDLHKIKFIGFEGAAFSAFAQRVAEHIDLKMRMDTKQHARKEATREMPEASARHQVTTKKMAASDRADENHSPELKKLNEKSAEFNDNDEKIAQLNQELQRNRQEQRDRIAREKNESILRKELAKAELNRERLAQEIKALADKVPEGIPPKLMPIIKKALKETGA